MPATADEHGVERPSLRADHSRQRGDRADHALAERDDRQQAIAFGDVMRVPWRAALAVSARTAQNSTPINSTTTTKVTGTVVCRKRWRSNRFARR